MGCAIPILSQRGIFQNFHELQQIEMRSQADEAVSLGAVGRSSAGAGYRRFAFEPVVLGGNCGDGVALTCSMVFALQFLIDAQKHLLPWSSASDVKTPDPLKDNFLGFGQSGSL
jgi:hypothetical protein